MRSEKGTALMEVIIAIALMGIIGVLFMSSAVNSTNARVQANERDSSKVLAESLMDRIKKDNYKTSYTDNLTIPSEFTGYSANLTVTSLGNGNIQKLTIIIKHLNQDVLTLESFKVKRDDTKKT
jgi:type II secretory pathway pseudopilin PulG